jgi:indolepyruvate ferredoxin oxidoreductase
VLPGLRLLARARRLRGTPWDPFQLMAHRRLERRLIGEYESVLDELLHGLARENLDLAVEIAALPEQIRGFDDVKERCIESVRTKQRELLDAFSRRS